MQERQRRTANLYCIATATRQREDEDPKQGKRVNRLGNGPEEVGLALNGFFLGEGVVLGEPDFGRSVKSG